MKDKIAEILLELEAVKLSTEPPFKWTSGILSPIYTDNRVLMSFPKQREIVIDAFIKLIKKNRIEFDGVAGTATAGIPWAAWITQKLDRPMIFVRKKSKEHGMQNLVEGVIEKGKNYLVVEDLVSTGGSSINTINGVRQQEGVVTDCLSIFTYELESAKNNFELASVKLSELTNFTSLVNKAKQENHISEEQLNNILQWKDDPEIWGRNI